MDLNVQLCSDQFVNYITEMHYDDIVNILELPAISNPLLEHYPLVVSFPKLMGKYPEVSNSILMNASKVLPFYDKILSEESSRIFYTLVELGKVNVSIKKNIHLRLSDVPLDTDTSSNGIPRIIDREKFKCFQGTVVRQLSSKMLEYEKNFKCIVCHHQFILEGKLSENYNLKCPSSMKCPNPSFHCPSKKFISTSTCAWQNTSRCKDYQEIKVQELTQKVSCGSIPSTIWVVLENDLVGQCQPGDDITVSGIVKIRWSPLVLREHIEIDVVFEANHIKRNNDGGNLNAEVNNEMIQFFKSFWEQYCDRPLDARNVIVSSISPDIYGLCSVKLAVSITLAGGVSRKDKSGSFHRGDSHLLLIGDPGSAKSFMLKYITKIVPRSVFTTGIGTTNAGLTVAATKEAGQWTLEAGALVLSDGGVCCIDEFCETCKKDNSIHEAMEQQTISVAKAGILCKLNTRCSVFAACNSKNGQMYNKYKNLQDNVNISPPILSRFDLIMVMMDEHDPEWDGFLADNILRTKSQNEERAENLSPTTSSIVYSDNELSGCSPNLPRQTSEELLWSLDVLKVYFSIVKHLKPTLTRSAEKVLKAYYVKQRQDTSRNLSRTTTRMIESIIRLAQGHAKLMFRDRVTLMDAIIVVDLMERSIPPSGAIKTRMGDFKFPDNAMENYFKKGGEILTMLSLPELITELTDYTNTSPEDSFQSSFDEGREFIRSFVQNRSFECETPDREQYLKNLRRISEHDVSTSEASSSFMGLKNTRVSDISRDSNVKQRTVSLLEELCHQHASSNTFSEFSGTPRQDSPNISQEITASTSSRVGSQDTHFSKTFFDDFEDEDFDF